MQKLKKVTEELEKEITREAEQIEATAVKTTIKSLFSPFKFIRIILFIAMSVVGPIIGIIKFEERMLHFQQDAQDTFLKIDKHLDKLDDKLDIITSNLAVVCASTKAGCK